MDEQRPKEGAVAEAADAPRILVVDDEPVIREVLSDLLTSEGYSVRTAENGAVALEELMRAPYNLVLTDLKMPVMGGEELLARLTEKKIKKIVIVLTAFVTVETAIQTMKNGAYDYVMKPFKIDEITLIVQRAHGKGAARAGKHPVERGPEALRDQRSATHTAPCRSPCWPALAA